MTLPNTVGVIGVGNLLSHMIPKLVESGARFIITARSQKHSGRLAWEGFNFWL